MCSCADLLGQHVVAGCRGPILMYIAIFFLCIAGDTEYSREKRREKLRQAALLTELTQLSYCGKDSVGFHGLSISRK